MLRRISTDNKEVSGVKRVAMCLAILACLLCGCAHEDASVVGRWVSDDNPAYYFELREDHSCYMFNADDEWISEGTYTADKRQISFRMDTGSFVWVRDDDVMRFEAGDVVTEYHQISP